MGFRQIIHFALLFTLISTSSQSWGFSFPEPPLFKAIKSGDKETARSLLTEDPKLAFSTNFTGMNPIHMAISHNDFETFQYILQVAPTAAALKTRSRKSTPLHLVAEADFDSSRYIDTLLELAPTTAFEQDSQGKTPLDYASNEIRVKILSFFRSPTCPVKVRPDQLDYLEMFLKEISK